LRLITWPTHRIDQFFQVAQALSYPAVLILDLQSYLCN
jgi:hypothetical protein